jgi:hypothetical protein
LCLSYWSKLKKDILIILKKYPKAKKTNSEQLVSVEKGGYRYLSPIRQIIGIESQIADLRQTLSLYERKKNIEKLKFSFFQKFKREIFNNENSERLFKIFLKNFDMFFKKLDLSNDINSNVYNDISVSLGKFKKLYNEDIRFFSPPSIPKRPIKSNKKMIIFSVFLFSIFFFSLSALLIEGWREYKGR